MAHRTKHRPSDPDTAPGFTVMGIPVNPKKGQEKKRVALSRAYGSRGAAEKVKELLDKAGCKDTWIREVGRPNT